MKRYLTIILLSLTLLLTGCAELVSTETREVDVIVIDSYHRNMWLQPIHAGKVTTWITHPAIYRITVLYNDIQYNIEGSDIYDQFKDDIGETVTGVLEIRTYDDGSTQSDIVGLI